MANVLVFGPNHQGVRSSVSIDPYLWSLVAYSHKSEPEAKDWVRSLMVSAKPDTSLSRYVQRLCIARIAKPSLLKGIQGKEQQIDIEEL